MWVPKGASDIDDTLCPPSPYLLAESETTSTTVTGCSGGGRGAPDCHSDTNRSQQSFPSGSWACRVTSRTTLSDEEWYVGYLEHSLWKFIQQNYRGIRISLNGRLIGPVYWWDLYVYISSFLGPTVEGVSLPFTHSFLSTELNGRFRSSCWKKR